jgi:hypothetical protein
MILPLEGSSDLCTRPRSNTGLRAERTTLSPLPTRLGILILPVAASREGLVRAPLWSLDICLVNFTLNLNLLRVAARWNSPVEIQFTVKIAAKACR